MKGIITVTSTFEVTPCPYIDFSLGNLRETPLKEVLARGMRNAWMGPYRPDCIIGEDQKFIQLHMEKTRGVTQLPVPWGQGFSDTEPVDTKHVGKDIQSHTQDLPNGALFDAQGRCIPSALNAPVHRATRRYFALTQPQIDYADIHSRIARHLGGAGTLPHKEFEQRASALLQQLRDDPACSSIVNGVGVPFFLPRAQYADYGSAMDATYLPAVQASFSERFPEYTFVNHHKQGLSTRLSIAPQSRHARLLDAMSRDSVVGYYFPCLTEYSVAAAREQTDKLPQRFLLAGGFDTAAALIGTPGLLQRGDGYPPLLWLAALNSEKENVGYHFEAYGHNLTFNRRPHFGQAAEYWASGLVVLD